MCPLPPVSGGRGTLAGEKGVGRVPILTRGIHCGTLYMYVLCGPAPRFSGNIYPNEGVKYPAQETIPQEDIGPGKNIVFHERNVAKHAVLQRVFF
jgi:hypothetical protein